VSLARTAKAFPALWRVGLAEALAYRTEMLVWVLATTMPLIMMALWTAVARDAPVGRFGQQEFVAYFLVTFVTRQLTGSWVAWQMNMEIRQGTLSMRLLRPVHVLVSYGVEVMASLPLRVVVAVPMALLILFTSASQGVTHDPVLWGVWFLAVAGGWLLTYLVNVIIGALVFFVGSSTKLMEAYFALFYVFAGYTVPVELFPKWLRVVSDFLPFRYQLSVAVEVATGRFDRAGALMALAQQWAYCVAVGLIAVWVWKRGLRRFEAFGG
jgi:ABC-2 type transport system permease protein